MKFSGDARDARSPRASRQRVRSESNWANLSRARTMRGTRDILNLTLFRIKSPPPLDLHLPHPG